MVAGVPFGAKKAFHAVSSKPSRPCSATDLTPGRRSVDLSEVTAMGFRRPELMCGRSAVMLSMMSGTCPLITSGSADADPL